MSKAALNQYTKGLARELASRHIRVNAIAPGGVATEICGLCAEDNLCWPGLGGRLFRPDEIAEIVIFLLNDSSKCINGKIITCNEGNSIKVEYFR